MKRQSKAEEALNKQIKILDHKLADYEIAIKSITDQMNATRDVRNQLVREVDDLKHARLTASERLSKG